MPMFDGQVHGLELLSLMKHIKMSDSDSPVASASKESTDGNLNCKTPSVAPKPRPILPKTVVADKPVTTCTVETKALTNNNTYVVSSAQSRVRFEYSAGPRRVILKTFQPLGQQNGQPTEQLRPLAYPKPVMVRLPLLHSVDTSRSILRPKVILTSNIIPNDNQQTKPSTTYVVTQINQNSPHGGAIYSKYGGKIGTYQPSLVRESNDLTMNALQAEDASELSSLQNVDKGKLGSSPIEKQDSANKSETLKSDTSFSGTTVKHQVKRFINLPLLVRNNNTNLYKHVLPVSELNSLTPTSVKSLLENDAIIESDSVTQEGTIDVATENNLRAGVNGENKSDSCQESHMTKQILVGGQMKTVKLKSIATNISTASKPLNNKKKSGQLGHSALKPNQSDLTNSGNAVTNGDEIHHQKHKKKAVSKGTQTDVHCWLYKNQKLYIMENDEDGQCTIDVVPVEKTRYSNVKDQQTSTSESNQSSEGSADSRKNIETQGSLTGNVNNNSDQENITTESCLINQNTLKENLDNNTGKCIKTREPGFNNVNNSVLPPLTANTTSNQNNSSVNGLLDQNHFKKPTAYNTNLKVGLNTPHLPPPLAKLLSTIQQDIAGCLNEDKHGNIPLHQAVIDNDLAKVKSQCIVLKYIRSHLDHENIDKETALMIAVKLAVNKAAALLVREGASVAKSDNEGCLPLHVAVKKGDLGLVQTLLDATEAHKVLDKYDSDGFTPIHLAAAGGHDEIIRLLVERKADINVKDRKSGKTPFYIAVDNGHLNTAATLIDLGADALEPDYAGHTPPMNKLQKVTENNKQAEKQIKEFRIVSPAKTADAFVQMKQPSPAKTADVFVAPNVPSPAKSIEAPVISSLKSNNVKKQIPLQAVETTGSDSEDDDLSILGVVINRKSPGPHSFVGSHQGEGVVVFNNTAPEVITLDELTSLNYEYNNHDGISVVEESNETGSTRNPKENKTTNKHTKLKRKKPQGREESDDISKTKTLEPSGVSNSKRSRKSKRISSLSFNEMLSS